MKCVKLIGLVLVFVSVQAMGQSLTGKWHGTYRIVCPGTQPDTSRSVNRFVKDFTKMLDPLAIKVQFKQNGLAKRSIKFPGKNAPRKTQKYKFSFDGSTIGLMDKKSNALIETYTIETLTSDSLVYSVVGKKCQKILLARKK